MRYNNIHFKFYFLFLLFIVSTLPAVAQTNNKLLQSIWENAQKPDSVRFNAIKKYYETNTTSQPDSVIKLTDFHFELAGKKTNNAEKIKALSERSYAYFAKDNAVKAEEIIKEAIQIQSTLNDKVGLARLYTNLASIYRTQSKFVETIRYYNYSLKIFEENKEEKNEAAVLGNLGLVYFDLKNYEIAANYFEKSLALYKKLNLQDKVGYIGLYVGAIDYEKGNYTKSIDLIEKALKIFEENNNLFSKSDCYALLAKSYQKTNKTDKSITNINKSLAINQKLENTTRIIQNKIFLAELYLDSDVSKATQIGEGVLAIIDSTSDKNSKASLYNLLYECYKKNNKIELSHKMYEKYIVHNDSIVKEQSNLALLKEAVNQEFKIKLSKTRESFEQSEKDLKRNQLIKLVLIILVCSLLVFSIYFYFRKKNISNRKKSEELLEEIKRLKSNNTASLVVNSNEFQLVREKIEQSINRKLNETDWVVLNILLKEPDIANRQIAEKAYLSIDGIGSSLRRMYFYFDIKESKYKKISLIMEAIKASNK
jgi:tetratricopeptide (TPR) repeat protein